MIAGICINIQKYHMHESFIATVMFLVQFYITGPSLCAQTVNSTLEALAADVPDIDCNQQVAPIPIVSMMFFFSAFTIGWGPVPGILLGELLPKSLCQRSSHGQRYCHFSEVEFCCRVIRKLLGFDEGCEPMVRMVVLLVGQLAICGICGRVVFET